MADFESLEVSNFRDIKPKKPLCPSSFPALRFESSCSTAIVGATAECQAPKLMARGGNAQCNAKSPAVGGWEAEILQPSNLQHLKKWKYDAEFDENFWEIIPNISSSNDSVLHRLKKS